MQQYIFLSNKQVPFIVRVRCKPPLLPTPSPWSADGAGLNNDPAAVICPKQINKKIQVKCTQPCERSSNSSSCSHAKPSALELVMISHDNIYMSVSAIPANMTAQTAMSQTPAEDLYAPSGTHSILVFFHSAPGLRHVSASLINSR